jgi:hypothetical protein
MNHLIARIEIETEEKLFALVLDLRQQGQGICGPSDAR